METVVDIPTLPLSGVIKEYILEHGPLSFHDFMEMALYYQGSGYYTSGQIRIGTKGDYYTSPEITPLLGAMIGRQIEEMWEIMNKEDFAIVEYGAGRGTLCRDILAYLQNNPALYENLTYHIVERNRREFEIEMLPEKVFIVESIKNFAPVSGCILSNELLDNFPVHRVIMEQELMEVFVDYTNDYIEVLQPASESISEYFSELDVILPRGFCTEVNLESIKWIEEISSSLKKGFVLTIDYGFPSHELYSWDRRFGTLMCYHKHKINNNPYINIGKQDITSHVNFSALSHWGVKNGFQNCGFTRQIYFLLALGLEEYIRKTEESFQGSKLSIQQRAFFIHTFLGEMGTRLKVLIQQKGLTPHKLSGLNFPLNNL